MNLSMNIRGQVAQEALMSFVIYTLFILVLLGALNYTLPQIQQKQEQKAQQEINIYRCTAIDMHATFKSQGIEINLTDVDKLNCMSHPDEKKGPVPFESHRQLD